jgi:tRNA nucleotidyltransferase (CCA-adding enzyme)
VLARVLPLLHGPVSAVGGVVRDAALGLPPGDEADLVVEGDAPALADELGHGLGVRAARHERFGTASLELPHGGRIDLAGARRERYPTPGALPVVEPGTLAEDLARRDFTVNAMALRLAGAGAGELVDPLGGMADLEARLLRALRPDAFTEDPSRIVRAARYAARLGFGLAPDTELALRRAAPALDPHSARVGEELRRLLEEPDPAGAAGLLRAWGVSWIADQPLEERLAALAAALARPGAPALPEWPLRMGALVARGRLDEVALPGWALALAREVGEGPELAARAGGRSRPSEIDDLLRTAPPATAVGAVAAGAEGVAQWWERWRDVQPAVRGADLVAAGVRPGPAVGRALAAVRAALLDGEVGGRLEQLALALEVAGERV